MTLNIKQIHSWPYGAHNAIRYISWVDYVDSNLELLLDHEEFIDELDIHQFVSTAEDDLILDTKKSNFYALELSNWTLKETLASAFFFLVKTKEKESSYGMYLYLKRFIDLLFNDDYCDIIVEIYIFFNVFDLYPEQCVNVCISFFSQKYWNAEDKACLNHFGLKKFLTKVGIKSEPLLEIIDLCNFFKLFDPFILYLNKYKKKNYDIFCCQSSYDQLFTTVESYDYIKLDNFYVNTNYDIEFFYSELSKVEKRRIFNFLFRASEKNITNNKIFLLSCLGLCLLLPLLHVKLSSPSRTSNYPREAPFATITGFNSFSSTSSTTYNSTSASAVRGTESQFPIPEHSSFKSDINKAKAEERHFAKKIFKKKLSFGTKFKNCLTPNTTDNVNHEQERPSTDSTDIPLSNASEVFPTSKRIIAGQRYKRKLQTKLIKESEIDSLFVKDSEYKFVRPIPFLNQHIIRKQFKPEIIEKYQVRNKYAYFIPDSKGNFNRVTLAGNFFSCAVNKKFTSYFKSIVNKDKNYTCLNHTFEHVFPDKWLDGMDLSRTPRSGAGDPAVGPLMGDLQNRLMGRSTIKLTAPYFNMGNDCF